MQRTIKLIPKITAPFNSILLLALLLTLILIIQGGIHSIIQDNTTVWQGTCSFKEWDESGDLGLVVDCGEYGESNISTDSFLRSYLKNPGPLMCELSAAGNISCENRPPLESDDD